MSSSIHSGGSSVDPFVVFAERANNVCNSFKSAVVGDFNSGSAALLSDTKSLIDALTNLGPSPSSDSSWRLGLEDWQQAVSFLAGGGDRQDWLINIWAGADVFRDMGIPACGSYHSIGE